MPEPFVASPGTDLLDLAWFPSPTWPEDLANIAQPEDWDDEGSGRHPILVNYLRYTARRLLEEKKWLQTTEEGNRVSAFNTGLLSRDYFEPVYAIFEQNRNVEKQPWVHKEWAVPSSPRLRPRRGRSRRSAVLEGCPSRRANS